MFNLKTIAIAVAISASALVSTVPSADARQKVVVIEHPHGKKHVGDYRRGRNNVSDYRAERRAEARRAEARRDRRHDRRHSNSGVVLKIR